MTILEEISAYAIMKKMYLFFSPVYNWPIGKPCLP